MAETKSPKEKHVAMVAFPFGSHPISGLHLLRKIASAAPKIHFSFIDTAKSTQSLLSKVRVEDVPPNVKFYEVADGVPEGHVLTGNPEEPLNLFLKAAPANLKNSIDMVVAETGYKITCLISHAFLTALAEIAEDTNVPWIASWTSHPCSLSAHVYTDLIRERCANSDGNCSGILNFIPGLSAMRIADLPEGVLISEDEEDSPFSLALRRTGWALPRATAVAMSSFRELSSPPLILDHRSKFQNVFYVGFASISLPLPPLPPSSSDRTGCLSWLDGQKSRSVAYLAFGTVALLPHEELIAVAEALKVSKVPFLWSLNDGSKELLPEGFLEKTRAYGKVVPWSPQTQVLAHVSVGVFVTHCGSGSVAEGIVNGVPLICRPFFGDQRMMGRMVEEWGIGVKVEEGAVTRNFLLKNLELILGDEQGKVMRGKAEALKEVVLKAVGGAAEDFNRLVDLISAS